MTRNEIISRVEIIISNPNFDPEEHQELLNCQRFGIDNDQLSVILQDVDCTCGTVEAVQSIVHFFPYN